MNSFHILPDDTVIVCVKSNGRKWELRCSAVDLRKAVLTSDAVFRALIPRDMPPHITTVFLYTYWELESRLIERDVFPWGLGERSSRWNAEWNSKHKP